MYVCIEVALRGDSWCVCSHVNSNTYLLLDLHCRVQTGLISQLLSVLFALHALAKNCPKKDSGLYLHRIIFSSSETFIVHAALSEHQLTWHRLVGWLSSNEWNQPLLF